VTVPLVVALAAGVGLASAFDVPARQAFLVEMVGPADLSGAIALNSSLFNTARVVGPAVAGSLVGVVGEAPCFLLNAASYLAVIGALALMRLPPAPPAAAPAPLGEGLRSGLEYVWRHPSLRNLLLLLGVISGLGIQYQVLMPVFARTVFGAGATGYGLLLTAAGLGALASGLGLAWRETSRAQQRRNLVLGLVFFTAGVLGVAASPSLPVALACQACAGFGMIRYTATTNTLLQLIVDDRYRGRVMGFHTVMFLGTGPVGSLALGALADQLGARLAACASGGVSLAGAVWLALRLRRIGSPAAH
jgi:MFS family permease